MYCHENITLEEVATLKDIFTIPRLDPEADNNIIAGISREAREKAVRMARQEIGSLLKYLATNPEYDWLGFIGTFERASSALPDEVLEAEFECEFYPNKHRNGDCQLRPKIRLGPAQFVGQY